MPVFGRYWPMRLSASHPDVARSHQWTMAAERSQRPLTGTGDRPPASATPVGISFPRGDSFTRAAPIDTGMAAILAAARRTPTWPMADRMPTMASSDGASAGLDRASDGEGAQVVALLEGMFSMTGLTLIDADISSGSTRSVHSSEQRSFSTASSRAESGMAYDVRGIYRESEQAHLAASGTVRTADGRTLAFTLDYRMARELTITREVGIRADGAGRGGPQAMGGRGMPLAEGTAGEDDDGGFRRGIEALFRSLRLWNGDGHPVSLDDAIGNPAWRSPVGGESIQVRWLRAMERVDVVV